MTGAGLGTPGGAAPNNTALDGFANGNASATSVMLPTFATTAAGKIIVFGELNATPGTCGVPTDSLGLTYTQRGTSGSITTSQFIEWSANSLGSHASIVVTISCSSAVFIEGSAFGVKGVNTGTNNGFDSSGTLPNGVASGASGSISTANANDYLYSACRAGSTTWPSSGFANIGTGSFLFVQAMTPHPTTMQSGLIIPDCGTNSGQIVDALISN
jgi:hypothetical protein